MSDLSVTTAVVCKLRCQPGFGNLWRFGWLIYHFRHCPLYRKFLNIIFDATHVNLSYFILWIVFTFPMSEGTFWEYPGGVFKPSNTKAYFIQSTRMRRSKSCHVGILWIALAEYSQISKGFNHFSCFIHYFVMAKLATSSIRV